MTEPWRRPHVQGFIVQCETCPQKAVVDIQPQAGWVCPRCTDAHGFGDVDIAQAEPIETGHDIGLTHAAEMFPQHQRRIPFPPECDLDYDDYPIGGVTA